LVRVGCVGAMFIIAMLVVLTVLVVCKQIMLFVKRNQCDTCDYFCYACTHNLWSFVCSAIRAGYYPEAVC
ncbi:MAG: hypothetical protein LBO79_09325, partial [Zoogloeaceae bacterium]|nr:hypothetical protein [Zoogloeaceae bacterium]